MSRPCEVCAGTGPWEAVYPELSIVRCPRCALVFWDGEADTAGLYTEKYFKGEEYQDYVLDKSIIQKNFEARLDDLRRLKPGGRLLEIGCAYGFFLEMAARHYDARGVDVTEAGVTHAREVLGLDATCADFLDLPDEPGAYDVVCMWDTVEHLPHPARFIDKAARWLAPGGVLVATTGDFASVVSQVRKERWRLVHPPSHLYYFTPETLGAAMIRAGLDVAGTRHVGYYRSLRGMVHGVLAANDKPTRWLYDAVLEKVTPDWPVYLNLFDIMMVTATKPTAAAG